MKKAITSITVAMKMYSKGFTKAWENGIEIYTK